MKPTAAKPQESTASSMTLETWLRFRSVGYMQGSGLAHGLDAPVYPTVGFIKDFAGVTAPASCIYADIPGAPGARPWTDVWSIQPFARRAFDFVYIGPRLVEVDDTEGFANDSVTLLKEGGHVLVWTPYSDQHTLADSIDLLGELGRWQVKEALERDGHTLVIAKRLPGKRGIEYRAETEKPRVCVVRYGAIGDMVMVTPLLERLAADGFHVTVNAQAFGGAVEVIKHNPNVHNVVVHERNIIPMSELDGYWTHWTSQYDRYINLSESIEGSLLKVEGRRDYFIPKALREATCGTTNYYLRTLERGGYSETVPPQGHLYFSPAEESWARRWMKPLAGRFVIGWGLNGSSFHKMYARTQEVLEKFLAAHPNASAVLMGSDSARFMQFEHPQVLCTAGDLQLRESLSLLPLLNCYVGPESGLLNAAACFPTLPKVALLSHSSPYNLTEAWPNTTTLTPDAAVAPCYPCHQMHYTRESCPLIQIGDDPIPEGPQAFLRAGPACAMGAIAPERLLEALESAYAVWSML